MSWPAPGTSTGSYTLAQRDPYGRPQTEDGHPEIPDFEQLFVDWLSGKKPEEESSDQMGTTLGNARLITRTPLVRPNKTVPIVPYTIARPTVESGGSMKREIAEDSALVKRKKRNTTLRFESSAKFEAIGLGEMEIRRLSGDDLKDFGDSQVYEIADTGTIEGVYYLVVAQDQSSFSLISVGTEGGVNDSDALLLASRVPFEPDSESEDIGITWTGVPPDEFLLSLLGDHAAIVMQDMGIEGSSLDGEFDQNWDAAISADHEPSPIYDPSQDGVAAFNDTDGVDFSLDPDDFMTDLTGVMGGEADPEAAGAGAGGGMDADFDFDDPENVPTDAGQVEDPDAEDDPDAAEDDKKVKIS